MENRANFAVSSPKLAPIFALQSPEKRKIYRTQTSGGQFCKWLILLGDAGALTIQVIHKWLNVFVWQSARFGGIARFAAGRQTEKAEAAGLKPRATRGDGECAETRAHGSVAVRENRRPAQDDNVGFGGAAAMLRREMTKQVRRSFMTLVRCTLLMRTRRAWMTHACALLERVPRHWKLVPATSRGWDDPVASARKSAERAAVWSAQSIRKQRREERQPVERETLPGGAERFPDEVLVTRDAIVEVYRGARVGGG
jgi:hypothetical protein